MTTVDYVGDEKLLETLQLLLHSIRGGVYTDDQKQEVFDSIVGYTTGCNTVDPLALKYMVLGYYVTRAVDAVTESNASKID